MATANITSGPTKQEFLGALGAGDFDGTKVTFQTESNGSLTFGIQSIEREDGSGDSFNFQGNNDQGNDKTGYYNTATKTGHVLEV